MGYQPQYQQRTNSFGTLGNQPVSPLSQGGFDRHSSPFVHTGADTSPAVSAHSRDSYTGQTSPLGGSSVLLPSGNAFIDGL